MCRAGVKLRVDSREVVLIETRLSFANLPSRTWV